MGWIGLLRNITNCYKYNKMRKSRPCYKYHKITLNCYKYNNWIPSYIFASIVTNITKNQLLLHLYICFFDPVYTYIFVSNLKLTPETP